MAAAQQVRPDVPNLLILRRQKVEYAPVALRSGCSGFRTHPEYAVTGIWGSVVKLIRDDDIRCPRVVDMDRQDHRGGLRKVVDEFITNLYLHHELTPAGGMGFPIPRSKPESAGSQLFHGAEPVFVR
jgi:hypothetical protein